VLHEVFFGAMRRGRGRELEAVLSTFGDHVDVAQDALARFDRSRDVEDLPLWLFAEAIQQWRYFDPIGLDRLLKVEIIRPFWEVFVERAGEEADDHRWTAGYATSLGLPYFDVEWAHEIQDLHFETATAYKKPCRERQSRFLQKQLAHLRADPSNIELARDAGVQATHEGSEVQGRCLMQAQNEAQVRLAIEQRLEWHGTDISRARQAFPSLARRIVNPWGRGFAT
jgi:hypothetical protein